MGYGVQVYCMKEIARNNLEDALEIAERVGYDGVEFAGFYGHTAEEVRDMLERHHLKVYGAHLGFADYIWNDLEAFIRYQKTIGNTRCIIPGHDLYTREKLDSFIEKCNEISPRLRAEGIDLIYHNHNREFLPVPEEGYIVHEELEKRCDILFEIDTYWAYVAGRDPLALLDHFGDRVPLIHIKDGSADGKIGCPLGRGEAPVADIWKKARDTGRDIVVEIENRKPSSEEVIRLCLEYMRSLE